MSEIQVHDGGGTQSITPANIGLSNVMFMLQSAIDKGISPDAIQKLADLSIQFAKIDAQKAFNAAFTAMQAEMPEIICDKKGPWGGSYADKESIMRQIRPTLMKHGFSINFNHPASDKPDRMITECILEHTAGHSIKNSMETRTGRPNKMMTEIQVDAGACYAGERYALCAMLNIRAEEASDDARVMGVLLTPDELQRLKDRAQETNFSVKSIFAMAGVDKWEDIRSGALQVLHNTMDEKERITKSKK